MGLVNEIYGFNTGTSPDDSVTGLLITAMEDQLKEHSMPKDYYYLTELINPAQSYWSRKHPEIERPKPLARRLARGKQLQRIASYWFRSLPNFAVEEGKVDGAWVGLDGVRGSIDYRFGKSVIELKTKTKLPDTADEIISLYPQDLEQLAFYSVIHTLGHDSNYLVFMGNSSPNDLKGFKVITREAGLIKGLIKNRMNELTKALEKEDPSYLGKCRYHGSGCHYGDSDKCFCKDLDPISSKVLVRAVEITEDAEFTKMLEDARDACKTSPSSSMTTFEIINPRKGFMKKVAGLDSKWVKDPLNEMYESCLWAAMNKLPIKLNPEEKKEVIDSQLEERVHIAFRWAKLRKSGKPDGEIIPYLKKISAIKDQAYTLKPAPYNIAELGIVCATYGKNTGYIFTVFPKIDKLCRVWRVTYKNVDQLLKIIRRVIDTTENAEQTKDLHSLHKCEDFLCNVSCPLWHECNPTPSSAAS
ncbi:MAG: hypothetical protein V3T58_07775 [Candidatus Hydrothermarchaeales archaeon]